MYPVRSSAAVRVRVEEFVSPPPPLPKSYYLTQQEQIVGQGVSGAFQTDMNWKKGSDVILYQSVSCVFKEAFKLITLVCSL